MSHNKTILFFDDWSIQNMRGVSRKWFAAEPWPGVEPAFDPLLDSSFNGSVAERCPETGRWRMWASGSMDRMKGDFGTGVYLYESSDGLAWTPAIQTPMADHRAMMPAGHLVFSGEQTGNGMLFRDEHETDPARRYKMAYTDCTENPVASDGRCRIATSPDGIHWTIDRQAVWRAQHTDAGCSIVYNPWTKKYQFTSRPILGDRRVAMYETTDWKTFTPPQVVIHPDCADPPCVEFYGMPHFFYEGYFVGFLFRQHAAFVDESRASRMLGAVDTELTYSINGTHWNRTNRQPMLSDNGIGRRSFLNEYPTSMVMDQDGWLRVYATSFVGEHSDCDKCPPGENLGFLTISRFRRDGFCAMQSVSDVGHLTLRPLISRGGSIRLNGVTSRFGSIRAELRTVPDNTPIPGYELENSVPIVGDGHELQLRWKKRDTIDAFSGEPFRLFLELNQARVYAVRVSADYLYGWVPEPNLVGDYIPNQCPACGFGRADAYPKADDNA